MAQTGRRSNALRSTDASRGDEADFAAGEAQESKAGVLTSRIEAKDQKGLRLLISGAHDSLPAADAQPVWAVRTSESRLKLAQTFCTSS